MKKKAVKTKAPKGSKQNKGKNKSKYTTWFMAILISFLVLLLIQTFTCQVFVISETHMMASLHPGDYVLVNKLNYGARMPYTPLSIPFQSLRVPGSEKDYFLDYIKLPYFRIPTSNKVEIGDILVFNNVTEDSVPVDCRVVFAKRCVAVTGDTLKLRQHKLYINNKELIVPSAQFEYRVAVKGRNISNKLINKYNLNEGGLINKYGEYDLFLTTQQAEALKTDKEILSVTEENENDIDITGNLFPFDSTFSWNLLKYGPIVIPGKGKTLSLNYSNILIYKSIIEQYEGKLLEVKPNGIFINGYKTDRYTFKYNYYFVLDDNRDNAYDSRYWGFIPEQFVIGKATRVLLSVNTNAGGFDKIRWNRILNKIK